MSDWRAGYREALLEYCRVNGYFVDRTNEEMIENILDGEYGFTYGLITDWDHRNCPVVFADGVEPVEISYEEFNSTFDGNNVIHAIVVPDASCSCGKHKNDYLVVRETLDMILRNLLNPTKN